MTDMTMVRVYVSEGEHKRHRSLADQIFNRLHEEHKVMGVTQFRGIAGFGSHGVVHAVDLMHINAPLPVIIEFFDNDETIKDAIAWIKELVEPERIVSWKIQVG